MPWRVIRAVGTAEAGVGARPIGRDEPIAALGAYWAKTYTAPQEVVDTLETLARAAAPIINWASESRPVRAVMEKTILDAYLAEVKKSGGKITQTTAQ